MGADDHILRFWRRVLVALILIGPALAQGQSTPSTATSPEQLALVIERMRRAPSDTQAVATARAVGFELLRGARYEDALTVFDAIRRVVPTDQRSLYGSALALFNLGRGTEAEQLAGLAIEVSAEASPRFAAESAGAVAETQRRSADALVLLGVILAVKGDNAGALTAVTKAVRLTPESFDAQFALGRARYGAGDPAGAATAFRAAARLKPDDAQTRFFLATALEGADDYVGALAAYRELVAIRPESAEGHLGAGVLLAKLGGDWTDEGIGELLRALSLNGDLYEARVTLARLLIHRGRAAEAVNHLRRAVELAPDNPEPHYQLALAYRRLGRDTEANAESNIVKKLHEARRQRREKTGSSISVSKHD